MRHRTYSRGGSGRNGGRRYQSRARKLQVRRTRSRASRGFTRARSTRRAVRVDQPAEALIGSEFTREACPARFSSCILTAYATRQRSGRRRIHRGSCACPLSQRVPDLPGRGVPQHLLARCARRAHAPPDRGIPRRSEEHTSELQSQFHLVCRLLLEKKKKINNISYLINKNKQREFIKI